MILTMVKMQSKQLKLVLNGWSANNVSRSEGYAIKAYTPEEARKKIASYSKDIPLVLVCPQLDWSWSDVANEVAGVITDHGTRVSRGSEVSGIVQVPAVLGTRIATSKINEGDFITIACEGMEALAKIFS